MKAFVCEMSVSRDHKNQHEYVYQHSETKYSTEETRKLIKNIINKHIFKAIAVFTIASFTALAFTGCGEENRNIAESKHESVQNISSEESQNPASDNSVLETTNQESSIEETSGIVSNSDIIVESSQYSEKSSEISDSSQEVLSTEEAMALIPSHSREEWKAIETISKDDIVCYARFINDRLEKYKPGDIVGIVGQI